MLGIDSPHGRYPTDQPGAGAGVRGRQWRGRVSGRRPGREVRLRRTDVAASGLRAAEPSRQGTGQAISAPVDRVGPRPVNAFDRALCGKGFSDGDAVSAAQVHRALHRSRRAPAGLRGSSSWDVERACHAAHPAAGVPRASHRSLPAIGGDQCGADLSLSQDRRVSQTPHQLPTHAAHTDPHRRTPQARSEGTAGIPARRHRAPRRSGRRQGLVSHQCGGSSHAVAGGGGHTAHLRSLAIAVVGSHAGAVPVPHPRFSFRQWQRVHQLPSLGAY